MWCLIRVCQIFLLMYIGGRLDSQACKHRECRLQMEERNVYCLLDVSNNSEGILNSVIVKYILLIIRLMIIIQVCYLKHKSLKQTVLKQSQNMLTEKIPRRGCNQKITKDIGFLLCSRFSLCKNSYYFHHVLNHLQTMFKKYEGYY